MACCLVQKSLMVLVFWMMGMTQFCACWAPHGYIRIIYIAYWR